MIVEVKVERWKAADQSQEEEKIENRKSISSPVRKPSIISASGNYALNTEQACYVIQQALLYLHFFHYYIKQINEYIF